jgi:RNA polymerase sigma-70 factor (ECF subfamily)
VLDSVAPKVLRVCRGVLGPHAADIDDAVQESLVALLRALPAWRGEGSLSHYACRIAVRVASRIRDKARTRGTVIAAAAAEQPTSTIPNASAELGAALRELLAELPPAQSETLVLRFVLDYSPAEIAEAMGVPVNTVRSRVRLGRTMLLERIGADPRLTELLGGDR